MPAERSLFRLRCCWSVPVNRTLPRETVCWLQAMMLAIGRRQLRLPACRSTAGAPAAASVSGRCLSSPRSRGPDGKPAACVQRTPSRRHSRAVGHRSWQGGSRVGCLASQPPPAGVPRLRAVRSQVSSAPMHRGRQYRFHSSRPSTSMTKDGRTKRMNKPESTRPPSMLTMNGTMKISSSVRS